MILLQHQAPLVDSWGQPAAVGSHVAVDSSLSWSQPSGAGAGAYGNQPDWYTESDSTAPGAAVVYGGGQQGAPVILY